MDDKQQKISSSASPSTNHEESSKDDASARNRLIEAAAKLFGENGLAGTSTRDIAKAADVNISLISYYFGGKEGLYKAVIEEFAVDAANRVYAFLDLIDPAEMTRESFKAFMLRFISEMLPMKLQTPNIQKILQREVMNGLPYAIDVYNQTFFQIAQTVAGFYVTAQKRGIVRPEINPYLVFISMVHATDMYFQVCECQTMVVDKLPKLPEEMDQYIQQTYMIFVEGVLK